jgi:DNA-binding GntR family transcriptional regulator
MLVKKNGTVRNASSFTGTEGVWPLEQSRDLTTIAYERIEELFVAMRIAPGAEIRTQDLQAMVSLGRTPVHQAVRRLAAETLLEIHPRNGLRVAPIDLSRERQLSVLRRDLNRFVTAMAIRNMTANDRAGVHHLRRKLAAEIDTMPVDAFNAVDKSFDRLLISASGERFLERVLSPLHAIARRIGYLHIAEISGRDGIVGSAERHIAIMDFILAGAEEKACAASDELVTYSAGLLQQLEEQIDPALLDIRYSIRSEKTDWPVPRQPL